MHGNYTTLKEIVLELDPPDPVGLHCNEQLDSSEDEVDELATQATQDVTQPYQIVTTCGTCNRNVRLVVQCTGTDICQLHTLLLGSLEILCPVCAPKN